MYKIQFVRAFYLPGQSEWSNKLKENVLAALADIFEAQTNN